jgi:hypothetical protein
MVVCNRFPVFLVFFFPGHFELLSADYEMCDAQKTLDDYLSLFGEGRDHDDSDRRPPTSRRVYLNSKIPF